MKKKYALAQFAGCLQLIFLLAVVLLWDHMLVMELPFELNIQKWNLNMYWIIALVILWAALTFMVMPCMKRSKNNNKVNRANPTWKDKIVMLVSNSCSGNWIDIIFVFLLLFFYMPWLADVCSDFVKTDLSPYRLLVYIIGLAIMIIFKPTVYKEPQEVNAENRTLLVTAISNITMTNNGPTIEPIIWPFEDYKNIKKVIVVLTDQIKLFCQNLTLEYEGSLNKAYKNYMYEMINLYCRYCKSDKEKVLKWSRVLEPQNKQILDSRNNDEKKHLLLEEIGIDNKSVLTLKLLVETTEDHLLKVEVEHLIRNLIKDCIQAYNIDCELTKLDVNNAIVFTEPINYDDFDDCNEKCYDKISSIMRSKFTDENVVVNITAGTAAVTSVLTINAIKGNRGMIYRKQNARKDDSLKMTLANPNVMMVQFNELFNEKSDNK